MKLKETHLGLVLEFLAGGLGGLLLGDGGFAADAAGAAALTVELPLQSGESEAVASPETAISGHESGCEAGGARASGCERRRGRKRGQRSCGQASAQSWCHLSPRERKGERESCRSKKRIICLASLLVCERAICQNPCKGLR